MSRKERMFLDIILPLQSKFDHLTNFHSSPCFSLGWFLSPLNSIRRSSLRGKLDLPSMSHSIPCSFLELSLSQLEHRWPTESKFDNSSIFHSNTCFLSRLISVSIRPFGEHGRVSSPLFDLLFNVVFLSRLIVASIGLNHCSSLRNKFSPSRTSHSNP